MQFTYVCLECLQTKRPRPYNGPVWEDLRRQYKRIHKDVHLPVCSGKPAEVEKLKLTFCFKDGPTEEAAQNVDTLPDKQVGLQPALVLHVCNTRTSRLPIVYSLSPRRGNVCIRSLVFPLRTCS